ncbi:MAG: tyrosine-type recombinase/integrase [Lachnospiraceae bacterium]|nr:tyrosine-type recombinase/integrase [Lachnospiraceae bacterium]
MNVKTKVTKYLEYCEFRKELDWKTLKAYRIDIRQYFDRIAADNPGKEEIESYITDLHRKYKQKTVKRKIASIKAFYNYLEEEEILTENPFRKIKVKFKEILQLPRIVPRNEIEKLLNYMYSNLHKTETGNLGERLRDVAIIEVFFATGARVCEISNLRQECMDLESGVLRIMGKGGKERYIQIADSDVITLLKKYYTVNEAEIKKCGYFFVNRQGKRFTEQSMRAMVKKYTVLAGIERHITPHMFRHSFATFLIEEGVDISCVQRILGHSSIRTTQIYIHVAAAKQAEILKNYHPRNKMAIKGIAA